MAERIAALEVGKMIPVGVAPEKFLLDMGRIIIEDVPEPYKSELSA